FKVTRKKVGQYIHSEKEMDEYLVKLGLTDLLIRRAGSTASYDKEQTEKLMDLALDVEHFVQSIERKGVSFRDFLVEAKQGKYPQYQVAIGDKMQFVYSESELIALKKENEERQKQI